MKAGRFAESIVEYQTSIRLRPNEAEAYLDLATLLIRQGRNAEGVRGSARLVVTPAPVASGRVSSRRTNWKRTKRFRFTASARARAASQCAQSPRAARRA